MLSPRARSVRTCSNPHARATSTGASSTGMVLDGHSPSAGPDAQDPCVDTRETESSARFCAQHAPKHSLHHSQLCCHPKCSKVASFTHQLNDIDKRDRARRQALRSFSVGSHRIVFCGAHAPHGFSDYRHLKCHTRDCSRQGIWVHALNAVSEAYCNKHREDFMVLRTPRRRSNTTSPPPSPPAAGMWGNPCELAEGGSLHNTLRNAPGGGASHNIGSVHSSELYHSSTITNAFSTPHHAHTHPLPAHTLAAPAGAAMSNAITASIGALLPPQKKCMHPLGCRLFASYGPTGENTRSCAAHKSPNDTYRRKTCQLVGCDARPTFGDAHCLTHCVAHRFYSPLANICFPLVFSFVCGLYGHMAPWDAWDSR